MVFSPASVISNVIIIASIILDFCFVLFQVYWPITLSIVVIVVVVVVGVVVAEIVVVFVLVVLIVAVVVVDSPKLDNMNISATKRN